MLSSVYYTTKLIDLFPLQQYFDNHHKNIVKEFNLKEDDFHHAYEWCVMEALSKTVSSVPHTKLEGHYRHDVYKCVYEKFGSFFLSFLSTTFLNHRIWFAPHLPIKAMVAGCNLFLAQGVPANARF